MWEHTCSMPPVVLMARTECKTSQPTDPFSHSSGHCSIVHSVSKRPFFQTFQPIYLILPPRRCFCALDFFSLSLFHCSTLNGCSLCQCDFHTKFAAAATRAWVMKFIVLFHSISQLPTHYLTFNRKFIGIYSCESTLMRAGERERQLKKKQHKTKLAISVRLPLSIAQTNIRRTKVSFSVVMICDVCWFSVGRLLFFFVLLIPISKW